jgi:hypothetical protein
MQNVDGLKEFVTLSGEKGTKVSLIRYVSPFFYGSPKGKSLNNEFDFIFPRQTDGSVKFKTDKKNSREAKSTRPGPTRA